MKVRLLFIGLVAVVLSGCTEQPQEYILHSPKQPKEIRLNPEMGGTAPDGGTIEVNNYYMSIDGKPVIPVMGEFHFSRYPREQWEEEILKMKAGGITVLPTYVFWALHEEHEGVFRWDGNLDLRHFLLLCQKHHMDVIIRIGPFCHGEMRSGAIPEWIFAKPLEVRSDDPMYLRYAKRLYGEIAKQMVGLYYKDGGPIIGCQIENEMQHSAAPWGICYPGEANDYTAASSDAAEASIGVAADHQMATGAEAGDEHMRTLLRLAQEAGIITPFYTATGWGNAAVIDNKAIPVTSAYTYPFWEKPFPSPFMLFKDIHANPDYAPVRYNPTDFPSFCAEMGAGIQMIYNSRPIVTDKAAEALMVRTLGSGCNGIGYYMYHGGSTPVREGQNAFMSDEPMGVPKISYDFQAPLGEFGLEGKMYRNLRMIHSFLADFGHLLAPMETVLPDNYATLTPDNRDYLRYAARMKDGAGFLFMVNFQDHDTLRHDMRDLAFRIDNLRIPKDGTFTLPKDESLILPFNLQMEGALLQYATAQLLMKLDDGGMPHYIFFAPEGIQPEFCIDNQVYPVRAGVGSTFDVTTEQGYEIRITTLKRAEALNAVKVNGKLLIADATILPTKNGAELLSLGNNKVDYILYPSDKGWDTQTVEVPAVEPEFSYERRLARRMTVHFPQPKQQEPQVQEYFLRIDYIADVAMAFMNDQLCQDEFYHGEPWIIGLKRYKKAMQTQDMNFYFRPLHDLPFIHRDLPEEAVPDFSNGPVLKVNDVSIIVQYKLEIKI
ncbi:MAG: beta-galactosidase [Paludibacteraceae bacterium]|nr:beta-galactosidase [Paludibacteraceae bacterium]